MLAERRIIKANDGSVFRTPLLVPSFSSKGFPDVGRILAFSEEFITESVLVSAYDLKFGKIAPPFDFASLIFLDSGGYEASKDAELSDVGDREHRPQTWSEQLYSEAVQTWSATVPTVIVSYDHPAQRIAIPDQVERAKRLTSPALGAIKEILLKPEKDTQKYVQIKSILSHIRLLADFDIIGFTEKELGGSILDRMEVIAKVRTALRQIGLGTPIHIFGSLDTVTTPMYFVAGADIFDGLTWLRYAFMDGYTVYRHNYGAIALGVAEKVHMVDTRCWANNLTYMRNMQNEMRRFLKEHDFSVFAHNRGLLQTAYQSTIEAVGS